MRHLGNAIRCGALIATFATLAAPPAAAQGYPERAVRIIVPTAPGGSIDTTARVVAAKLSDTWGKPVIIENRPGAAMITGADAAAKSPPDGYTLLVAHDGTTAMNQAIYPATLPYNAQRDFEPVSLMTTIPLVMLVHAVETGKFVDAWTGYKAAVRTLATGQASDPKLGGRSFVSAARIQPGLNRLSWSSTTPYLSVLVAPRLAPTRLVVDPDANYFWTSCQTAKANEAAPRAVPMASRRLLRTLECLHR